MTVTICSRRMIEERIANNSLQNSAVISFSDPKGGRRGEDYGPVNFGDACARVFFISVYDLDPDALARFGYTMDSYFDEADAVARFIHEAVSCGLEIVCQCEYGQSRSAGLASAILEHYERRGIEIFRDYPVCNFHNPAVVHISIGSAKRSAHQARKRLSQFQHTKLSFIFIL